MEIELLGHKGKIDSVFARPVNPPWSQSEKIFVSIDFTDEPFDSIIGTAVELPVADYDSVSLIKALKEHGEPQLKETLARHLKESDTAEKSHERQIELDAVADKVKANIGLTDEQADSKVG